MSTGLPLIFCAVDTRDPDIAAGLAAAMSRAECGVKIGLEFFNAQGIDNVAAILRNYPDLPLFLDLKFHDIPNTVAGAARAVARLAPAYINVHAAGGRAMMRAAQDAARDEADKIGTAVPKILAVTALTSLSAVELAETGVARALSDHVAGLTELALESGMDGIVCSAHEAALIREKFGAAPVLMVPGIRPATHEAGSDDQSRIMTPAQAVKAGATHLVIGRPITGADDPVKAARALLADALGA